MLLTKPPPTPTHSERIPSNLLDTYVRYKQDTRAIIAWLISHGTRKYKNLKIVSIRDLISLGEIVRAKAVVMPDAIHFCFREAIGARTQLTKFFRQKNSPDNVDQETDNHEFFTVSLTQIYTGLCECCAKPSEDCKSTQARGSVDESGAGPNNRFAVLRLEHHEHQCDFKEASNPSHTSRCTKPHTDTPSKAKCSPRLVDDPLSDAFEVRKGIQDMTDVLSATTHIWEQAARGEMPLVLAAFMTNAALAMFEEVEQRVKVLCGGSDPEILRAKLIQIQDCLDTDEYNEDEDDPRLLPSSQMEALRSIWQLLLQFKEGTQAGATTSPTARPSQITVRRGPGSNSMDRECYTTFLGNIGSQIRAQRQPTSVVLAGTPLYPDVGYFLTHKENDTNGLRCSFGLQMLLESYKSYLLAPGSNHPPSNCRLQALQFAQEVARGLVPVLDDSSMPCRCCQTLASHLENFKLDLESFIRERAFDLYFQSPWVAGSHALEILETSFYYGLRLFSYRHFVGSVLHVYNILRELTGFQEIPLFESLCCTFNDILFPGGRPSRNFRACCLRYMGGRLRFNNQTSDHKPGCHKFEIPVSAAKSTAGFGLRKEANDARFEYRKVSILHYTKERAYHLDESLWQRILHRNNDSDHSTPTKPHKRRSCHHHQPPQPPFSTTSQHRLCQLQAATIPELTGPCPIAKIDFFSVYMACVKIVSIISDKMHGEKDQGARCLCFLEIMVAAADRCRENEHKLQPFGCRELVESCKRAVVEVVGDRSPEEFLWRGI